MVDCTNMHTGIHHHYDVMHLWSTMQENISLSSNFSYCYNIVWYLDNFPSQVNMTNLQNKYVSINDNHNLPYLIDWTYFQQSPPLALIATFWKNWLSPKHVVIPIKTSNHNIVKIIVFMLWKRLHPLYLPITTYFSPLQW